MGGVVADLASGGVHGVEEGGIGQGADAREQRLVQRGLLVPHLGAAVGNVGHGLHQHVEQRGALAGDAFLQGVGHG